MHEAKLIELKGERDKPRITKTLAFLSQPLIELLAQKTGKDIEELNSVSQQDPVDVFTLPNSKGNIF